MSETTRKKASANYALEVYGNKAAEGWDIWFELMDGFVSPEAALAYAKADKVQGVLRVVRVASPIYGGDVVTPEPVYSLKKIEVEEKKSKPRKPRVSKASETPGLVGQSQHISREQALKAFGSDEPQAPAQNASVERLPDPPPVIPLLPETEQTGDLDPIPPDPAEGAEELDDSNP
jgi:hypothetical protein